MLRTIPLVLNPAYRRDDPGYKRYEPSLWNKNEVVWQTGGPDLIIRAPCKSAGVSLGDSSAILCLTLHYHSNGAPEPESVTGWMLNRTVEYRINNASIVYQ